MDYLSDATTLCIVEVPAYGLVAAILQYHAPQSSALVISCHKAEEPSKLLNIIFRTKNAALARFDQAIEKRLDCHFQRAERSLTLRWTWKHSAGQAIRHDAKRLCGQP